MEEAKYPQTDAQMPFSDTNFNTSDRSKKCDGQTFPHEVFKTDTLPQKIVKVKSADGKVTNTYKIVQVKNAPTEETNEKVFVQKQPTNVDQKELQNLMGNVAECTSTNNSDKRFTRCDVLNSPNRGPQELFALNSPKKSPGYIFSKLSKSVMLNSCIKNSPECYPEKSSKSPTLNIPVEKSPYLDLIMECDTKLECTEDPTFATCPKLECIEDLPSTAYTKVESGEDPMSTACAELQNDATKTRLNLPRNNKGRFVKASVFKRTQRFRESLMRRRMEGTLGKRNLTYQSLEHKDISTPSLNTRKSNKKRRFMFTKYGFVTAQREFSDDETIDKRDEEYTPYHSKSALKMQNMLKNQTFNKNLPVSSQKGQISVKNDGSGDNGIDTNQDEIGDGIKVFNEWQFPVAMADEFSKICKVCYSLHKNNDGPCPLNNPRNVIPNKEDSVLGYELPEDITIGYSRIYPNTVSVFARNDIKELTQFGPLRGRRVTNEELSSLKYTDIELDHFWPIETVEPQDGHDCLQVDEYLDTKDVASSNWLRYLVPETFEQMLQNSQETSANYFNIQRVLKDNEIYFVTTRKLVAGEELVLRCMEPPDRVYFNLSTYASSIESNILTFVQHCFRCSTVFDNVRALVRHFRLRHTQMPGLCDIAHVYKCSFCGKEHDKIRQLKRHREREHLQYCSEKCYQCVYCKLYFSKCERMLSHIKDKHDVAEYTCTQCPATAGTHSASTRHAKEHNAKETQCAHCSKVFSSQYQLARHIRQVHTKSEFKMCEACGKKFFDINALRVHSLTHSGIKPFQCDMEGCTAAYTTKQCLQIHYRKTHGFNDNNMPEIKRKIPFEDIESYVPSPPKYVICEFCSKGFTTQFRFEKHMEKSPSNPENKCDRCGSKFQCSGALGQHKRYDHPGEFTAPKKVAEEFKETTQDTRAHETSVKAGSSMENFVTYIQIESAHCTKEVVVMKPKCANGNEKLGIDEVDQANGEETENEYICES